ncbi:MAG: MMPL family transporter, partial [Pseudomonadales bacterium]|nr:MMPL family transporter [Pseudomonadales bacterium]
QELPTTPEELAQLKQRVQGKELYYGRLINEKEDTVALFIKLLPYELVVDQSGQEHYQNLSDADMLEGSHEIEAVLDTFKSRFSGDMYLGGSPALGAYMSTVIQDDFTVFTSVAVLMVAGFLAFLFRRVSGVLIPLLVMTLGITSCIAMMPILGYPMQITTSILPSFLLAVCIGDAVHLLTIFYRRYDEGVEKNAAMLYALSHTGVAVLFTSLTTAAGLLTFSISDIQPIASLGLFAALGSIIAFLLTVTMVPVLITLLPLKRRSVSSDDQQMKQGTLLWKFTHFSLWLAISHSKKVVLVSLVIAIVALSQLPNLRFSQDSLTWFPDDTPVKMAIKAIEENITGTMPLEIIIDTGVEQGALNPVFLQQIDSWLTAINGTEMEGIKIRSINSLLNLIKETNQAFNGNSPDAYRIPDNQELIAQELLLIEMDEADDLYSYTDSGFQKLRITLIVPWADAIILKDFQGRVLESFDEHVTEDVEIALTGLIPVFSTMFTAMITSAANSYLIAALAIGFMMIVLMRGVVDGLLSMIPNLLPIIIVLAFMTLMDIPLDVFTILIGSIALGLCVDDTVHFMHGFQVAYKHHGNAQRAIEETLTSTGKALLITSVVLFFGFLTFTLSDLKNMDNFGMLTALCIVFALLADFILAPALMMLRYGHTVPDEDNSAVSAQSITPHQG